MDDFYQVTTPATDYPVNLDQAKSFMKVDGDADDDFIKLLIAIVTEEGQKFTNRTFITTGYTGSFSNAQASRCERYPFLALRRAPLIAIASFKQMVDDSLVDVDTDAYQLKNTSGFARILITDSLTFDDVSYPLQVVFTAGYGAPKNVPPMIINNLLEHMLFLYENRGDVNADGKVTMPPQVRASYKRGFKIIDTF